MHYDSVEKSTWDVSRSDGRLTIESQVAVCTFIFSRHCYILANARRTIGSCKTSSQNALQCSATMKLNRLKVFTYCIDQLGHFICPWRLKVWKWTIDAIWCLGQTTMVTELRSFLDFCYIFCRFAPKFCLNSLLVNKEPSRDQIQTFDRLVDYKITTLRTPKAKLVKPFVLALLRLQGV